MYLSHFQLNLEPFQVNTDRRFLYLSDTHQEALANLHYGILDNRGILVLTGDVGTGKTILVHTLVENLGPTVKTAVITDPSLKGLDFFNFTAHAFGMKGDFKTKGEFLIDFNRFLDHLFEANQQALLIIDEVQYMDPVQLEEIRFLSNIEREHSHRINLFLVGQSEFDSMLADHRLRALQQRITTHYHINPLTLKECSLYVQHRLHVAGCDRPLFTPSAMKRIFKLSKGCPRLINIICDHCLLAAFVKDLPEVGPAIVKECASDLMHPSQLNTKKPYHPGKSPSFTPQFHTSTPTPRVSDLPPPEATQPVRQQPASGRLKPFAFLSQIFLRKSA